MKSILPICATVIGLMAPAAAQATCTQADLSGTWTAYTVAQPNNQALAWVVCSLVINAGGVLTTATSACENSNGVTARPQGRISLAKAAICAFSGSIDYPAYGVGGTIQSLTLAMNKQSGTGIGTGSSGVFVLNMVKVK